MHFETKDNFSVTFHYQQGFETDKSDPGLNIHTLGNTKNTPVDKIGENFYSSQMFEELESFIGLVDAFENKQDGKWFRDDAPEEATMKFKFKKNELTLWIVNLDDKFCKCEFDKKTTSQIISLLKKIKKDWMKINKKPTTKARKFLKKFF